MKLTGIITVLAFLAVPMAGIAANGEAIYKAKCTACHGADGTGATPMGKKLGLRDFGSAEVQSQTDEQLAKITAEGKGKMPAYAGKLSPEEIQALVELVRTFKK